MNPEWLLCFSVAKRLGGVALVPLIQIKQIRTGGRHSAHESLAAKVVSGRES